MANYTNLMGRSTSNPPAMSADDISALIPEDVTKEIIKGAVYKSVALSLFRHKNMGTKQQRMPVLSVLPFAYFVNGDTGLKQTTEINWTNKYLNAEEIAVILPIPENVVDDISYNIWDEAKPLIEEAVAVCLDDAVLFGINAPASWPSSIAVAALAAGNVYTRGTSGVDIAEDLNQVMTLVEADGYDVNGWVIRTQFKGALRGLRDANRDFLFSPNGPAEQGVSDQAYLGTIYNEPAYTNKGGLSGFANTGGAGFYEAIGGDWRQGIIGIRQDMTYKMLDQAVLQDGSGNIVFNLAQQDMVAMRLTIRVGFQVPNPPNRLQPTESSRYPFGLLRQV